MKPRFFSLLVLATALFLFGYNSPSDSTRKNEILLQVLTNGLEYYHYEPQTLNNDFSHKVFDLYLSRLDNNKRFLLQSDVEKLKKFETTIDDEVQASTYKLFDMASKIFTQRINDVQGYYETILAAPFDFEIKESIELDGDKLEFAKTEADLQERWRKILKYQVLRKLASNLKKQEEALAKGDDSVEQKSFETLEKEAREKVLKNENNRFDRLLKLDRNDMLSNYLNAITSAYDPHTNYYPPKDKEDFDIAMSGRLEGIGARLSQPEGEIKVNEIVPGSASWRQGQLKAGDIILKVAQADEEPVDVEDMLLDKAVRLIRGKKGTEVRLTVRKPDGVLKEIAIIRDVVEIEEGYAKSTIINNEKSKSPIGYIHLPKFYADFSNNGGRSCATDVAKEIEKLNAENIDGLILDLRNNGGGSLKDVVDMGGLFIETGPIVQVKSRKGEPYIYRDRDPSVQYNGPLVILVNSFSASASEILAAAMQDYKRAIIIGNAPTFGKGTVQRFIDLDQAVEAPEYADIRPLGSLKLTIQKFYRINGTTNQLKGVVPDLVLPDEYSYFEVGEKESDYAMPWDEIEPLAFEQWSHPSVKRFDKIIRNSQSRVAANTTFQLMEENAQRLKTQSEKTDYTLCLDIYRAEEIENEETSKKYEKLTDEIVPGMEISTLMQDKMMIEADTSKAKRFETFVEGVGKDIYVEEAVNVLLEMQ